MIEHKKYDRNDNDTYVEMFSKRMDTDVEIHMFRDEKGSQVCGNNVRGFFSTESAKTAANNVLRFAKATDIGLVKIKDATLTTIVPMSLVQRYELSEENLKYKQKTPIFYDIKIDKFVVLMDYRFLRDVNAEELYLNDFKKIIKIYKDKRNNNLMHLGLVFETMEHAQKMCSRNNISENDDPFEKVHEAYKHYNMAIRGGEKVIIVKFGITENERTKYFGLSNNDFVGKGLTTIGFNFEYAVSVRFGKRYYICDTEGNIFQKSSFHLDKVKAQNSLSTKDIMSLSNYERALYENEHVFVVPYSDEQFSLIDGLGKRLNALHQELRDLFVGATNKESESDNQIASISDGKGKFLPFLGVNNE